ncbi:Hypothetical predicted protein [Paramuricea clavata]|uniref:Uncharacterized protein n=1 Tax=Paramuricea clavata TaxID=317549 RepID=A0A7D9ED74_PARCT|nr:Hypothetical predicted protein [Paramuricea clavata]
MGSPFSSRTSQNPVLGFLSSRLNDSCQAFDRENAHFSISEALICAIEQMKCENAYDSDLDEDDDDESDEEILQLRAKIKRKMARKRRSKKQEGVFPDAMSSSTKSTGTSLSSGSPRSSFSSREPPKSVDSDYNSSNELPSPESSKSQKRVERHDLIPSGTSLDTSSLETSGSPISAEQVALCLLEKVASRKNLTSADLKWMVSEHDVPHSLLPLPTAIPVSPDDELYDTTEHFDRRTSLPCRLRGNLEWAPPRQQIIFSIPSNPKRKETMTKQGYRCAGCGMRIDPGYMKRFRYCNYLGKYFCNTCHSSKPTVIPARIIQRWDFKEYPFNLKLCLAKGFVCEYCKNGDDIIYPFEVKRCSQCPDCGSCYHRECFAKGKCPKCERLLLRKKAAEVFKFGPDEDELT